MKKKRLLELAGVQLNEATGVYAVTFDGGDGTYLGFVGPFSNSNQAKAYFRKHKELEGIDVQFDESMTPDEYLESFKDGA